MSLMVTGSHLRGSATRRCGGDQAALSVLSGHWPVRAPIMFSMRSQHVPHPVQAPVASETDSTESAPLSIAALTSSVVTALQFGKAILTFLGWEDPVGGRVKGQLAGSPGE